MHFVQHGIYTVKVVHRALIIDATGPFNDELINSYRKDLESCICQLEPTAWGQVLTLHDQSLFTPEAEKNLIASLVQRKRRGLVLSAVVSDSPYQLVKDQVSRIYATAGVEHCFVDNETEATALINATLNKII